MSRVRFTIAVAVAAVVWSGTARAATPHGTIERVTRFIESLSPSQHYGGLGALLVLLAIVSAKREWSMLLTTLSAVGGVVSLAAAGVMWFLLPEMRRGDRIIAEHHQHKADVGDPCTASSECMHGEICASVRGAPRCWYPCSAGKSCSPPLTCVRASGGERVCTQ